MKNKYFPFLAFLVLYAAVTFSVWKKYEWNPASMIHFGAEFAVKNASRMPENSIVERGSAGDLGAGYDGQIFYFYSRTISELSWDWPKGFDESYRAPRIGYPFLIGLFGFAGKKAAVFGMYFWNISLFILSVLALRSMLNEKHRYLSWFYVLSPFSLGSYSVLVSDSVMTSLVIIAYYFFVTGRNIPFILTASLSILTKEPSLFLYFPLGLEALQKKDWKKTALTASILIIPAAWQLYLRATFPNWSASRLADFVTFFDGIIQYGSQLSQNFSLSNLKETARLLSRLPLFALLVTGVYAVFTGNIRRGWVFRLGLGLDFIMIASASFYHFWSVYENISRMFTVSIPMMIFLQQEDEESNTKPYLYMCALILILFLVKTLFIQKTQDYLIWK